MENRADFENQKPNNDGEITEREKKLLQQYRKLCEENKLTIDILVQRLLTHEKGRE